MEIKESILEAFQATSLILVFLSMLFTINYPKIIKDLNLEIRNGERAKKKQKDKLIKNFLIHCVPTFLLSLSSLYLFSPLTLKIIKNIEFKLWNFSFLPMSFLFIVIWVCFIFIWITILTYKMLNKIKSIKIIDSN
jgi:hypothetical protein